MLIARPYIQIWSTVTLGTRSSLLSRISKRVLAQLTWIFNFSSKWTLAKNADNMWQNVQFCSLALLSATFVLLLRPFISFTSIKNKLYPLLLLTVFTLPCLALAADPPVVEADWALVLEGSPAIRKLNLGCKWKLWWERGI